MEASRGNWAIGEELDSDRNSDTVPDFNIAADPEQLPAPDSPSTKTGGDETIKPGQATSPDDEATIMLAPDRVVELRPPDWPRNFNNNSKRPAAATDYAPPKSKPKRRRRQSDEDLVHQYLTEIGEYPLLSAEKEVELAKVIEAGVKAKAQLDADESMSDENRCVYEACAVAGEEAKLNFTRSNLRLVVSIAKKYQASGLPLLDLIQEGNLGLMHAVEKFDWRKGFKFSTYATWWIRQAITRGIANTGRNIRLPVHAADELFELRTSRELLERKLGRSATLSEVAAAAGIDEDKAALLIEMGRELVSLSRTLSQDRETEIAETIADPNAPSPSDAAVEAMLPSELRQAMSGLSHREQEILTLRMGSRAERCTYDEVGRRLNLRRDAVREIERRALSKLRHPSNAIDLRELL